MSTRDGRHLHAQRREGPATATAVFESGLAANRSYWALVQQHLAGPSIVYDRSGLGRSAPATGPRRLRDLAEDLVDVIDAIPGEIVLVGHSWGGPITRLAAARRRDRVVGLVLVDPSDEGCDLVFGRPARIAEAVGQIGSAALARLGLLATAYRSTLGALPEDARQDMRTEGFTVATTKTRKAELAAVVADLRSLRETPPDLGGIGVTVISGALNSAGMGAKVRAAVTEAHRASAARAGGRHVLAPNSGHMVPVTDPALVADEVRRHFTRSL
ncbi:alpha/beta fold hydrolase [Lentzea cavernae]|uniref:alpha/beta fold hydrolase n=1 Tax=Lentzea cavernae TaxID=2020703 RepID=UPI001E59E015|nr:alpha/beta hydrolase [Lentzea cavernae]